MNTSEALGSELSELLLAFAATGRGIVIPENFSSTGAIFTSALPPETGRRFERALAQFHSTADELRQPARDRLTAVESMMDPRSYDMLVGTRAQQKEMRQQFALEAKALKEELSRLPLVVWNDPEASRATVLDMVCNKSLYGAITLYDEGCRVARLVSKQGSSARIAESGTAILAAGGEKGTLIRSHTGGASIFLSAGTDRPVMNYYTTASPDLINILGSRITKKKSELPLVGRAVVIYGDPEPNHTIHASDFLALMTEFHAIGAKPQQERFQVVFPAAEHEMKAWQAFSESRLSDFAGKAYTVKVHEHRMEASVSLIVATAFRAVVARRALEWIQDTANKSKTLRLTLEDLETARRYATHLVRTSRALAHVMAQIANSATARAAKAVTDAALELVVAKLKNEIAAAGGNLTRTKALGIGGVTLGILSRIVKGDHGIEEISHQIPGPGNRVVRTYRLKAGEAPWVVTMTAVPSEPPIPEPSGMLSTKDDADRLAETVASMYTSSDYYWLPLELVMRLPNFSQDLLVQMVMRQIEVAAHGDSHIEFDKDSGFRVNLAGRPTFYTTTPQDILDAVARYQSVATAAGAVVRELEAAVDKEILTAPDTNTPGQLEYLSKFLYHTLERCGGNMPMRAVLATPGYNADVVEQILVQQRERAASGKPYIARKCGGLSIQPADLIVTHNADEPPVPDANSPENLENLSQVIRDFRSFRRRLPSYLTDALGALPKESRDGVWARVKELEAAVKQPAHDELHAELDRKMLSQQLLDLVNCKGGRVSQEQATSLFGLPLETLQASLEGQDTCGPHVVYDSDKAFFRLCNGDNAPTYATPSEALQNAIALADEIRAGRVDKIDPTTLAGPEQQAVTLFLTQLNAGARLRVEQIQAIPGMSHRALSYCLTRPGVAFDIETGGYWMQPLGAQTDDHGEDAAFLAACDKAVPETMCLGQVLTEALRSKVRMSLKEVVALPGMTPAKLTDVMAEQRKFADAGEAHVAIREGGYQLVTRATGIARGYEVGVETARHMRVLDTLRVTGPMTLEQMQAKFEMSEQYLEAIMSLQLRRKELGLPYIQLEQGLYKWAGGK